MRNPTLKLAGLAAAVALASCKSSDIEPFTPFCTAFTSPSVTESTPLNTTVRSGTGGKEVDGDLDTPVIYDATPGTTSATLKIRVAGGSTVASGALVGAFVTDPSEATGAVRTIRTYVGATLKETATGSALTLKHTGGGTQALGYIGYPTTQDFDAMEYEVTYSYPNTATPAAGVFEICSDGDVDS